MNFRNLPIQWVLIILFTVWVLYLLYKVAEHVHAWPFGQ